MEWGEEMKTRTCEEIWHDLAVELREKVGADRYDRWLAPLRVDSAGEDEIRLGVPNKFWLEWIEDRYLPVIASSMSGKAGRAVRISLVIHPELFQQLRRSQREALAGFPWGKAGESSLAQPWPSASIVPAGAGDLGTRAVVPAGFPRPASSGPRPAASPWASSGTLDDFVVGGSNQLAFNAALQVASSPGEHYNPLFIHGSSGLGKTHLLRGILHALQRRDGSWPARYLTGEEFLNQFVSSLKGGTITRFRQLYRAPQLLLVDDVHLLGNKLKTQEEFLHTFNYLMDSGNQVVLASDCHPRTIENLRKPLMGRFLSGLVAEVGKPDFDTRLRILRQRQERSIGQFTDEVLRLSAETLRGNVREILGAFNLLEAASRSMGTALTAAEAKDLLGQSLLVRERRPSLGRIVEAVADYYQMSLRALSASGRQRSLTLPRQVAMYLARKYTDRSLAEIGKAFGDRNHTSVKSAESKIQQLLVTMPALAKDVEKIIDSFED